MSKQSSAIRWPFYRTQFIHRHFYSQLIVLSYVITFKLSRILLEIGRRVIQLIAQVKTEISTIVNKNTAVRASIYRPTSSDWSHFKNDFQARTSGAELQAT